MKLIPPNPAGGARFGIYWGFENTAGLFLNQIAFPREEKMTRRTTRQPNSLPGAINLPRTRWWLDVVAILLTLWTEPSQIWIHSILMMIGHHLGWDYGWLIEIGHHLWYNLRIKLVIPALDIRNGISSPLVMSRKCHFLRIKLVIPALDIRNGISSPLVMSGFRQSKQF
jgi:hypothetical protein